MSQLVSAGCVRRATAVLFVLTSVHDGPRPRLAARGVLSGSTCWSGPVAGQGPLWDCGSSILAALRVAATRLRSVARSAAVSSLNVGVP